MRNPLDTIAGNEVIAAPARGKPLPRLASDEEAEAFVASVDLSDHDLSALKKTRFAVFGETGDDAVTDHAGG